MSAPVPEVTVRPAGEAAVLVVVGDVDGASAPALTSAYDTAATPDVRVVVLDLSAVGYLNSSGIAVLVSLLGRARREGRRLAAAGLSEHFRTVFEVTRLTDYIALFPDAGAALAACGAATG